MQLNRLRLKSQSNSQSPLKWTENQSLVYFSRLELLDRELIPWRTYMKVNNLTFFKNNYLLWISKPYKKVISVNI
jgi:hypothetical protein